jgi:hypothetical protein
MYQGIGVPMCTKTREEARPMTPMISRRVDYTAASVGWTKFLIGTEENLAVLEWIAENLNGPWSSRLPLLSEVEGYLGREPEDGNYLILAFADEDDAAAFRLWRAVPKGRA